jgi:iron complex outermembrane receptor protein
VGGGTITSTYPIYTTTTYENAGKIHVEGIDFDLAGHFDFGALGKFSPQLNWSHEIVWDVSSCYNGDCATLHLAGTHGPSGISGDTGNPKDKGVLTLAWDKGPLNITATVNYVGPYSLTDPSIGTDTCSQAIDSSYNATKFYNGYTPGKYCVVKEFVDVNLYARYSITRNFDVFGSIQNLFNTPLPVDLQTYGAGGYALAYNPALAQDGAIGMMFSAGFKWKL